MNDLDDWLNSLGFNEAPSEPVTVPPPAQSAATQLQPSPSVQPVAISQQPQEAPSINLSLDDFNDILTENGFEPVYSEAEEVTEEDEGEEEYNENGVGGMDIDVSENTHLDSLAQAEAITTGTWNPVFLNTDGIQAVQSVNEDDYPEHNPDEDAPIVMEADMLAIREEVSENALEAFNAVEETQPTPAQEPLIPYNSQTLLINNATSRFSGTEWYNEIQKQRIILAGCGGIGSWTILQLARMNPAALFMYDDDIVEQANMSGQLYSQEDVGKAKVDAMVNMIRNYTTMRSIYAIKDKFTQNSEAGDVMICGFDNMAARKTFYNSWKNHVLSKPEEERYKCLFLDGRLSISVLQVFCLTGNVYFDWEEYEKNHLFTDAEAEETQCSLKQTTYLACMIGSIIVNLFTNFTANLLNPVLPYNLPFFTEYDAQNMIFRLIK